MGVGAGLYMCNVVKKFTFAISSPDEFLFSYSYAVYIVRISANVYCMIYDDIDIMSSQLNPLTA